MRAVPLEDAISRGGAPTRRVLNSRPRPFSTSSASWPARSRWPRPFFSQIDRHTGSWLEFAILATSVALAQLFVVRTPGNTSFHTSIVFLLAAALLLPPELVVLIGIVQHVPEWLKERYTWYIQSFNICNFTLTSLARVGRVPLDPRARTG